jgi:hypothetical protein
MPEAAIWRANSLPMPDDAPVMSAHGPNQTRNIKSLHSEISGKA